MRQCGEASAVAAARGTSELNMWLSIGTWAAINRFIVVKAHDAAGHVEARLRFRGQDALADKLIHEIVSQRGADNALHG